MSKRRQRPHTAPYSLRMPEELRARLERRAKEEDRSLSWIILNYLWLATAADAEKYGDCQPEKDPS